MDNTKKSVDWKQCLEHSNNNPELAKDLLSLMAQELPVFQTNIKLALSQQNMDKLKQVLHKLHGACCYCGVPTLKNMVTALEKDLQTGQNIDIKARTHQVILELNNIKKELVTLTHIDA